MYIECLIPRKQKQPNNPPRFMSPVEKTRHQIRDWNETRGWWKWASFSVTSEVDRVGRGSTVSYDWSHKIRRELQVRGSAADAFIASRPIL